MSYGYSLEILRNYLKENLLPSCTLSEFATDVGISLDRKQTLTVTTREGNVFSETLPMDTSFWSAADSESLLSSSVRSTTSSTKQNVWIRKNGNNKAEEENLKLLLTCNKLKLNLIDQFCTKGG